MRDMQSYLQWKEWNDMLGVGKKQREYQKVEECVTLVEDALRRCGLEPSEHRRDNKGPGWYVERGTSYISIVVIQGKDCNSIGMFTPLVYVPEQNLIPIYKKCLELNFGMGDCAFSLYDNEIHIVSSRLALGLESEDVAEMFVIVKEEANRYDNVLDDEFSAMMYSKHLANI